MMRYNLIEVKEDERAIILEAADKSYTVTIDATDEAWDGKETGLEVITSPGGATVYYFDEDGNESHVNYRFSEDGAEKVS